MADSELPPRDEEPRRIRPADDQPAESDLITGQDVARPEENDWEDEDELVLGRNRMIVHFTYLPFTLLNIFHTRFTRPVWQFILSPVGLEVLLAIIGILGFGRYRSNMSLAKTPTTALFLQRQQALFDYRPPTAPPPTFIDKFTQSHPSFVPILSFLTGPNASQTHSPEKQELNSANLPSGVLYYTRTQSPYSLLNGGWHRTELNQLLPWELLFPHLRHNYTSIMNIWHDITPFSSKEEIDNSTLLQIMLVQHELESDPGLRILRPASAAPLAIHSESNYEDLSWLEKITSKLYPFLVQNRLKGPYQKQFRSNEEEEKALEEDIRLRDPDGIHYRPRDIIDALVLAHATLINPAARCQYHLASETPDWYGVPVRGSCGTSETLPGTWQRHLDEYKYHDLEWGSDRS